MELTIVYEIGSTTTVVSAFNLQGTPALVGQGQAPTTVLEGDVSLGLKNALLDLKGKIGDFTVKEALASSSAAGGLKMTVHGLVYNMTAKAAKEAALGAGAIISFITAGKLMASDLKKIKEINPKLILLAGGVDFGERETVVYNTQKLKDAGINIPVIYAGNIACREDIREIFGEDYPLYIVDNVYPKIDELNVEPARKIIQKAFEQHIIHAPGMEKIREMVEGPIIPTPGAVMESARILAEELGPLMVFDVGGATTDVHSVADDPPGSEKLIVTPEPKAKRTVEGDLGVYVNARQVVELILGENPVKEEVEKYEKLLSEHKPLPQTPEDIAFTEELTRKAVVTAAYRHAGKVKYFFTATGRQAYIEGKDLTGVRYMIGTGGALTRLPAGREILHDLKNHLRPEDLLPKDYEVLLDRQYIMAPVGVLAKKYPDQAKMLLLGTVL